MWDDLKARLKGKKGWTCDFCHGSGHYEWTCEARKNQVEMQWGDVIQDAPVVNSHPKKELP